MSTFPWRITGTETQQAITRQAIEAIKFPFEILTFSRQPELGWRDLNSGQYIKTGELEARHHEGHHEDKAEPLFGKVNGRNYVLGVYYPGSANIYIDNALTGSYAHYALATISAEIAHAVDESILSDGQREAFISLLCKGHGAHSWWELVDYGAEYYNLIGETFMILFTKGYSELPFTGADDFYHSGHNLTGEDVRAIIGIDRTDHPAFVHYIGGADIYHKPTHNFKNGKPVKVPFDLTGFRPCKVCRP